MLKIHPKTNDLYCSVSAARSGSNFPVAGGIWKSSDGGDTWVELTQGLRITWLNGFCVHPEDPDIVLFAAATTPREAQGGVHRTIDGGETWQHVLTDADMGVAYTHGLFVDFHPDDPNIVYHSSLAGFWLSRDGGTTWEVREEVPFGVPHRVAFDPRDRRPDVHLHRRCGRPAWPGSEVAFMGESTCRTTGTSPSVWSFATSLPGTSN